MKIKSARWRPPFPIYWETRFLVSVMTLASIAGVMLAIFSYMVYGKSCKILGRFIQTRLKKTWKKSQRTKLGGWAGYYQSSLIEMRHPRKSVPNYCLQFRKARWGDHRKSARKVSRNGKNILLTVSTHDDDWTVSEREH